MLARADIPHTRRFAGRASLDLDHGLRSLARCEASLGGASSADLEAGERHAARAHGFFSAALGDLLRMKAWAIPAELPAGPSRGPASTARSA